MCWSGEPGTLGHIESTEEILVRRISEQSQLNRYDFLEERVQSILLKNWKETDVVLSGINRE